MVTGIVGRERVEGGDGLLDPLQNFQENSAHQLATAGRHNSLSPGAREGGFPASSGAIGVQLGVSRLRGLRVLLVRLRVGQLVNHGFYARGGQWA